ncbi:MAG: aspartate aminotransferase family protein [Planctomycetes bacterium]|nr:aspartate aminotransferase family protein [Planctomycetota bacterium]
MRVWQTNSFEDVVLTRGSACTVWDERGKPYLDLLAGCWCAVLGHGHPRLVDAVQAQAARLIHAGPPFLADEIHCALAQLAEILPRELERVVFLNTGSEAVELALKMARAATGANGIAVVERSFYGDTTYALSLSEAGRNVRWLPPLGSTIRIPAPDCRNCPASTRWPCQGFPCLARLRELIEKQDHSVAAIIFEPVLANAGIIVPPPGYSACLRDLAAQLGALFIAEEVTTGMGRTGRWFAFERDGAVPDILVIGKALGGGLPVAAVATTAEVESRCGGHLEHMQSHQNDPFSGRIATTVIATLQDEGLVQRAAESGDYLRSRLKGLQSRMTCISDVRGQGLMVGIELDRDYSPKGVEIARRLLDAGFIVNYQPHNAAFRLFPPYVITRPEIDAFVEALAAILSGLV